ATSLFASFHLEVLEITIPLDYFASAEQTVRNSAFAIQLALHPSGSSNMPNLLHTSASYESILHMPKRKF
ncbi:unnamed protein product, partial [Musa textilis]